MEVEINQVGGFLVRSEMTWRGQCRAQGQRAGLESRGPAAGSPPLGREELADLSRVAVSPSSRFLERIPFFRNKIANQKGGMLAACLLLWSNTLAIHLGKKEFILAYTSRWDTVHCG